MSNCDSCPSNGTCTSSAESCGVVNNPNNKIKKVIGVMSGKGGVGKSTVTSLIAKTLADRGLNVGIMDADLTGPSIPRLMGVRDLKATTDGTLMYPVVAENGIKVMSMNLMMDDESTPVIWRGPVIANVVKQFYNETLWGELDCLLIDMPPGTGDVALTVMQSLPLSGVVMVSVPQSMVSMIVAKAVNMAETMEVPVLGVIENMSYIQCPNCDEKIKMFDDDEIEDYISNHDLKLLGELPMCKEVIDITHKGVTEISDGLQKVMNDIVENLI